VYWKKMRNFSRICSIPALSVASKSFNWLLEFTTVRLRHQNVVPGYTFGVRLPSKTEGVGNAGSEITGTLVGLMEMSLICDTLAGSMSLSPK
jgi:hypothetical protein